MRSKIALLVTLVVAATALIALPSSASAKTIKLYVTPTYDLVNACRPAAGQVTFQMRFGAKFQRKNSAYPKSVKFSYSVRDQAGVSFSSGSVTLKRSEGWKKKLSKRMTAASGTTIYFKVCGSFRSPTTGKLLKNSDSFPFQVASDEQLLANGVPPCV